MADFTYRGVDRAGKKVEGKLDVSSEGELRMTLRGMGIRPVMIRRIGAMAGGGATASKKKGVGSKLSVPVKVSILFTRQLQLLISSGIPLVQALEMLTDQTTHVGMRAAISEIRERVSGGAYLWESLNAYPRVFPKLYVALMRAGENSGSTDSMLKRLSKYLEDEDRLRRMIQSAMMYPMIVLCIGFGVVAMMLAFVIPKFEEMLKQGNQELPDITQFVINSSHFFQHNFLVIMGCIFGGGYLIKRFVATEEGRSIKDHILFKAPLFGTLAQKAGVARFCRTLQTLLAAGVNLIDSIDICKASADNAVLEEAIGKIRGDIEQGKTLGSVLNQMAVFPKMASQMIMVGESTGNLDKSLDKIADFFESDVEVLVGGMTKMIEPIVIVVLGGLVGAIMLAMYMPIFKMAGGVG
ncbi:MAG: type II secretion system F family protein [Oligoflexia bacterium]|nr:type II secretion system F family protein [Oligoflexia bacterium]